MPPCPDLANLIQRERAVHLLIQAMQRDMEGQRELLAARVQGRTDDVYRDEHAGIDRHRERVAFLIQESREAILRLNLATRSVRERVARTRALLDLP